MSFLRNIVLLLGLLVLVRVDAADADEQSDKLSVFGAGLWSDGLSSHGVHTLHLWIDVGVRESLSVTGKVASVGVRLTTDEWSTSEDLYAIPDGFERVDADDGQTYASWSIDWTVGSFAHHSPAPSEIEYGVFADIDGRRIWSDQNNFWVRDFVDRVHPVRKLSHDIARFTFAKGASVDGAIRTWDRSTRLDVGQVFVRYTIDEWASFNEVSAQRLSLHNWNFRIANIRHSWNLLPRRLLYAVRFVNSAGDTAWDNNGGWDFEVELQPHFEILGPTGGIVSGYDDATALVTTDLPLQRSEHSIDGGEFRAGLSAHLSSIELTDGEHSVEFRVVTEGGLVQTAKLEFKAKTGVRPISTWTVPRAQLMPRSLWDLVAHRGTFVFLRSTNELAQYDGFGSEPERVVSVTLDFERSGRVSHLAGDTAGGVFALSTSAITHLDSNLDFDLSFGHNGILPVEFCYAGPGASDGSALYILDTCNYRLVKLNSTDGSLLGERPIFGEGKFGRAIPNGIVIDDQGLWVSAGSQLHLLDHVDLHTILIYRAPALSNLAGLARTSDSVFWTRFNHDSIAAFRLPDDAASSEDLEFASEPFRFSNAVLVGVDVDQDGYALALDAQSPSKLIKLALPN